MAVTGEIRINGNVDLGSKADIALQLGDVLEIDATRSRQPINLKVTGTAKIVSIKDEGLTQGYMIFGTPGSGKTHFIRKLLNQILSLHSDKPDIRFGGLLIDPKNDFPYDVSDRLKELNRPNAVLISPDTPEQGHVNIFHCGLDPENLAKVLTATCTALAPGADNYFHNNLGVALSAILVALYVLERTKPDNSEPVAPTIVLLLDILTGYVDNSIKRDSTTEAAPVAKRNIHKFQMEPKSPIGQVNLVSSAQQVVNRGRSAAPTAARKRVARKRRLLDFIEKIEQRANLDTPGAQPLTKDDRAKLRHSANNLRDFLAEEKYYVSVQLFKQAFEEFRRLPFLNREELLSQENLYDDIINNGRVVVISVPPSETYARSVFTLAKNIFQTVVLDRFARFTDQGDTENHDNVELPRITNDQRPVFLICDEYHLSASDSPDKGLGDSKFLSLARTFGCFSLLATQGLNQLKKSPIGERWEVIIGLLKAKIFFQVGDSSTAEYAEQLGGDDDAILVTTNSSQARDGTSYGQSDSFSKIERLSRNTVMRFRRGQAAVVGTLDGKSESEVRIINVPK